MTEEGRSKVSKRRMDSYHNKVVEVSWKLSNDIRDAHFYICFQFNLIYIVPKARNIDHLIVYATRHENYYDWCDLVERKGFGWLDPKIQIIKDPSFLLTHWNSVLRERVKEILITKSMEANK